MAYHIDVQETLVTAERLCLQLLTHPELPDEVRAVVIGRNVAVMTPDSERSNPLNGPHRTLDTLGIVTENGATQEGIFEEPGTSTALPGNEDNSAINVDQERNDLSMTTSGIQQDNVQPLNVEPSSDDDIVVISEEAENVF